MEATEVHSVAHKSSSTHRFQVLWPYLLGMGQKQEKSAASGHPGQNHQRLQIYAISCRIPTQQVSLSLSDNFCDANLISVRKDEPLQDPQMHKKCMRMYFWMPPVYFQGWTEECHDFYGDQTPLHQWIVYNEEFEISRLHFYHFAYSRE